MVPSLSFRIGYLFNFRYLNSLRLGGLLFNMVGAEVWYAAYPRSSGEPNRSSVHTFFSQHALLLSTARTVVMAERPPKIKSFPTIGYPLIIF